MTTQLKKEDLDIDALGEQFISLYESFKEKVLKTDELNDWYSWLAEDANLLQGFSRELDPTYHMKAGRLFATLTLVVGTQRLMREAYFGNYGLFDRTLETVNGFWDLARGELLQIESEVNFEMQMEQIKELLDKLGVRLDEDTPSTD